MKAMKYTGAAVLSFLFLSSGNFSNTAITLQNPVAATGNGSSITDYHAGVWLQNCNDAHVVGEGDDADPDIQNDAAASGTNLFRGIDVENSTNVRINCNVIADIPLPINLTGNCDLSKLRYNKMSGYEHGVNLDPNAFIPTQGDLDAGSGQFIPYDNQWDYAGTEPPNILKVSETNTIINWYYQGSNIYTNPYYPKPATFNVFPQSTGLTGNNDCSDFSRYAVRENSIGKAVYDSLEFNENVEENLYMAKLAAYRALKTDNWLLDQGKADDYIYYDFLSDMNQSNAKLFDSVYVLIQDTATLTAAQNLNSPITGTNNVEYCRKAVNDLLISYLISGELSSGDTTVLDSIARLPLSLAGDAIYTAAALLGLEIHQQFNIQQERKAEIKIDPQKPPTVRDVFMYPNPAFDKAYFYLKPLQQEELVLIEIYDSNGNKIMMLPAPTHDTFALDVRTFAAGMYSFTITANKKVFKGTFIKSK